MATLHKPWCLQAMLQAKLSSLPPKLQHQAWHAHDMTRKMIHCRRLDWLYYWLSQWQGTHFLLRRLLQVSCLQTVLRYENKQLQCQAWRQLLGTLSSWYCLKLYLRLMTLGLSFHKPGMSVSEGPFQKQVVENMTWPCFKCKRQGGQPRSKGNVFRSSAFETWNSEQLHDVVCICQVHQRRWMKSLFALSMPVPAPRAPILARHKTRKRQTKKANRSEMALLA